MAGSVSFLEKKYDDWDVDRKYLKAIPTVEKVNNSNYNVYVPYKKKGING